MGQVTGDTDIAAVAGILADPGQARMILALGDGRALAASTLAAEAGVAWLDDFGVKIPTGSRRPLIRYCVDWSEQRHHLAGALGAGLLDRLTDQGWLRRSPTSRAVHVTSEGRAGLASTFGIETGNG